MTLHTRRGDRQAIRAHCWIEAGLAAFRSACSRVANISRRWHRSDRCRTGSRGGVLGRPRACRAVAGERVTCLPSPRRKADVHRNSCGADPRQTPNGFPDPVIETRPLRACADSAAHRPPRFAGRRACRNRRELERAFDQSNSSSDSLRRLARQLGGPNVEMRERAHGIARTKDGLFPSALQAIMRLTIDPALVAIVSCESSFIRRCPVRRTGLMRSSRQPPAYTAAGARAAERSSYNCDRSRVVGSCQPYNRNLVNLAPLIRRCAQGLQLDGAARVKATMPALHREHACTEPLYVNASTYHWMYRAGSASKQRPSRQGRRMPISGRRIAAPHHHHHRAEDGMTTTTNLIEIGFVRPHRGDDGIERRGSSADVAARSQAHEKPESSSEGVTLCRTDQHPMRTVRTDFLISLWSVVIPSSGRVMVRGGLADAGCRWPSAAAVSESAVASRPAATNPVDGSGRFHVRRVRVHDL